MFTGGVRLVSRVCSSQATVLAVSALQIGPCTSAEHRMWWVWSRKRAAAGCRGHQRPQEAGPAGCPDGDWIWMLGAFVKAPSVERMVSMALLARVTEWSFLKFWRLESWKASGKSSGFLDTNCNSVLSGMVQLCSEKIELGQHLSLRVKMSLQIKKEMLRGFITDISV